MKLDDYLKRHDLTEAEFGAMIGISQPQVNRLRRGIRWPNRETAKAIAAATKGRVTADDFMEPAS